MTRLARPLLLVPLLLSGCNGRTVPSPPPDAAARPADDAQEREARKAEYRRETRAKLDELEDKLADLRARAEAAGAEVRARLEPQIKWLREQTRSLETRLERLKDDTAAAWDAAQPELERALESVHKAYRKAADEFDR